MPTFGEKSNRIHTFSMTSPGMYNPFWKETFESSRLFIKLNIQIHGNVHVSSAKIIFFLLLMKNTSFFARSNGNIFIRLKFFFESSRMDKKFILKISIKNKIKNKIPLKDHKVAFVLYLNSSTKVQDTPYLQCFFCGLKF